MLTAHWPKWFWKQKSNLLPLKPKEMIDFQAIRYNTISGYSAASVSRDHYSIYKNKQQGLLNLHNQHLRKQYTKIITQKSVIR